MAHDNCKSMNECNWDFSLQLTCVVSPHVNFCDYFKFIEFNASYIGLCNGFSPSQHSTEVHQEVRVESYNYAV